MFVITKKMKKLDTIIFFKLIILMADNVEIHILASTAQF